jgi:hypothetical protein
MAFHRHVLVADVSLLLQFQKVGLVDDEVLEESQLPDPFAQEHLARDTQQLDHVGIHVHHPPRPGIEDQNTVPGRLEEPAIAKLRSS